MPQMELYVKILPSMTATCGICGKQFRGRDEKIAKRFFYMHIEKSHPEVEFYEERKQRPVKETIQKQKAMNTNQAKIYNL